MLIICHFFFDFSACYRLGFHRGLGCLPLVEGVVSTTPIQTDTSLADTPRQTTPSRPPWPDPPGRQAPPGQTPSWPDTLLARHPPGQTPSLPSACWDTHTLSTACWDTVNKWAARILLECILVLFRPLHNTVVTL